MNSVDEKKIAAHMAVVVQRLDDIKEWLDRHQKSDDKNFTRLNLRINGIYKYAISVAIVAVAVGYIVGKI